MDSWFKSQPIAVDFSNVDEENGIIKNVVMAQAGPAKGHGVHLEASFISSLIDYDKKYHSKSGIKARFGHPSMSDSTMGSQMGYFKNFRSEEGKAIADLHLLDSADKSPTKPGMKEWMLSMSKEAKDFVMSSIVFQPSGHYQYDPETGEMIQLKEHERGGIIPQFEGEKIFVDFNTSQGAKHYYTDLVEAGAATDALFSQQFNKDKFAVRTVEWLQQNPDILSFIKENPHKLTEMCESLNIPIVMSETKKKKSFLQHMQDYFNDSPGVVEEVEASEAEAPAEEEFASSAEVVEATEITEEAPAEEALSAIQKGFADLNKKFTSFDKRLSTIEETSFVAPVGVADDLDEGNSNSEFICNTTLKAMKR